MDNGRRLNATIGMAIPLAALLAVVIPAGVLFLRYPPVWPDEGLFANPAINLLRHGHMGTTLIGDLIPGMDRRTYWMPPDYTLVLAGVFRVFGTGIEQMRALSVACGLGTLAAVYALSLRLARTHLVAGMATAALLLLEPLFLRGSFIGRMDIMAVLFGLLALLVYSSDGDASKGGHTSLRMAVAGFLAATAFATHPLGAPALFGMGLHACAAAIRDRRGRQLALLTLGALVGLSPWIAYVLGDTSGFIAQFGGQLARKAAREPLGIGILMVPFNEFGDRRTLAIAGWLAASAGLLTLRRASSAIAITGFATFAIVAVSREMWYPLYLLPYMALGMAALAGCAIRGGTGSRAWFRAIPLALGLLLALQAKTGYETVSRLSEGYVSRKADTDYGRYCDSVSSALPFGATVTIAAIPDPYPGLAVRRPDLTMRHFVPEGIPVDHDRYIQRLADSDYLIVTDHLRGTAVGGYAEQGNAVPVIEIGNNDGVSYHAIIYRVN